ncbi:hypothetical protein S7711_00334 [Stachybotrys chartarum IBT 7711]|uniref:LPXTG-motif cell wall anchor domain protein n=1 Tax=Stachybotrys chartarum (strain CBS 109288 / IBT 7711) TaxID=1280523 RepID=A0A084B9E5_STACB|nr:hypothetical protein S7711_00334 [Stachybotrys chartarum IBT 7711]
MTEQASAAAHGPNISTAATTATTSTTTIPAKSLFRDDNHEAPPLSLHSHRQSHSSSKLPAFRFADLKSGAPALSHLALIQHVPTPPSPVSPPSGPAAPSLSSPPAAAPDQPAVPGESSSTAPRSEDLYVFRSPVAARDDQRTPATTTSTAVPTPGGLPTEIKRSASFPEPSAHDPDTARATPLAVSSQARRRISAARTSSGTLLSGGRVLTLDTPHPPAGESTRGGQPPLGQRELILPKTLSQASPTDEKRMASSHRPPPVSYRRPSTSASTQASPTTPIRVPPIRAFRSSGSRKSLILDMNLVRSPEYADDTPDSNHDRTLRALEGRPKQDTGQVTPPTSIQQDDATDGDDTVDVFLKIAREESPRRTSDASNAVDASSAVSRVRSQHRRPLSTAVASYKPTSPPRLSRRLSDQQDTSRKRHYEDDRASDVSRITTYRTLAREKAASIFPGEDLIRARTFGTGLRSSPLTPRSALGHDSNNEPFIYPRRQPSVTDSGAAATAPRASAYKAASTVTTQNKSHASSPLVRTSDQQGQTGQEAAPQGVEGTESTASTTAPSTVWDELDDLKSRIHRLELTGKLPATSGAAVSRLSDERPPTATTTVTTMSSSPKRSLAGAAQSTEVASTTSSQREGHPLLNSALAKSKPFLNPEVFRALEAAASEALALSSLMGTPGQPGPISSGASTIGTATNVTDRQLRRKADSVCRSLTELCVALGEEVIKPTAAAPPPTTNPQPQAEAPVTPTVPKPINTSTAQRRLSTAGEADLAKALTSPRAVSKFEERRHNLLNGNTLPSPRSAITSSTPLPSVEVTPNRRSSLMVARSRRAGTEEPDDGRKSTILRTRRAGTEEPDEGRRTSLLIRGRRGTADGEDEELRFRAPSRTATEVQGIRSVTREYHAPAPAPVQAQGPAAEATTQVASTIPRRRFVSSSAYTSRLAAPATTLNLPSKRYLERSTEREPYQGAESVVDDRGQRQPSMGHSNFLNRATSLSSRRQARDGVPATSTTGGYR